MQGKRKASARVTRGVRLADHEAGTIDVVAAVRGMPPATFIREAALKAALDELVDLLGSKSGGIDGATDEGATTVRPSKR